MEKQVTKRYRLLKDLPYTKNGVIYTPENDSPYYYNYNGGEFRNRLSADYVENNPDWFEEVKDAPFELEWVHFNRSYENGAQFMFKSEMYINPDKFKDKIKKAIENIVNGVDEKVVATYYGRPEEKTAVGFDEHAKIYSAAEVIQLQKEAFYVARYKRGGAVFMGQEMPYLYLEFEDFNKRRGDNVDLFINTFLVPDIYRQKDSHFELSYHSLKHYVVYERKNQEAICSAIERMGFSVRCGVAHKYVGRQGLQEIVFECSKSMRFNHRFTDQINGEIKYGVNS